MDCNRVRGQRKNGYWVEILDRIVRGSIANQRLQYLIVVAAQEQRVAVGSCTGSLDDAKRAAAAAAIVDHNGAERCLQVVCPQAPGDVMHATRCRRDDQTYGSRWIGLRPRGARHGR